MALISNNRRFLVLAAVTLLAGSHHAAAFAPNKPLYKSTTRLPVALQETVADVSIEYDAAAKLAYSEWREKYDKGDFDAARYEAFRSNYEALTVANVVAAKKARDEKSETPPRRLDLNEFADMTAEEYMAMQSGETLEPAETTEKSEETDNSQKVDLLSAAFESTVSQSEAASAIEEAATALAEEEKILAEKLGLESVEELEVALDSMAGVAEDGGELDPANLSREARIRSAYLDWCKEYGKEPDEDRFPTFSSNFLVMEEYAQENGKDMQLNKYADCTEEEYVALTSGVEVAVEEKEVEEVEETAEEEAEEVVSETVAEEEAVEEAVEEKEDEEAAAAAAEAEAKAAAEKAEAEAKAAAEKAAAEAKAAEEKAAAEAKAAAEKAAAEAAAKEAAKLPKIGTVPKKPAPVAKVEKVDLEKEAIALANAIAAAEADQIAKRRAFDAAAAEKVRKEAEEFRQQAAKLPDMTLPTVTPEPEPEPVKEAPKSFFNFPKPAPKPVAPKKEAPKKSTIGSFFSKPAEVSAPKKAAPAPKKAPAAPKKPAPVKAQESKPFFGGLLPKKEPAAPKVVPAPAPVKKAPVASEKTVAIKTNDPVTDAFASFFGSSKKEEPKVEPTPAPAPKVEPTPKSAAKTFSLFGSKPAAPKPAPKVEPTPAPKPAPQPFSLFGSKPAAPKAAPKVEPTPAPTPAPKPFSLFGSKPAAPKAAPKVEPTPAPTPAPKPFSFFGGSAAPKAAPKAAPTPAPKPAAKRSMFGTTKSPTPAATIKISSAKKPVKRSMGGTINLKSAAKPSPAATTPVKKSSGTFSIFGKPAQKVQKEAAAKSINLKSAAKPSPAATTPVKKSSGTFSIFGKPAQKVQKEAAAKSAPVKKAAAVKPQPGVPVLKNWKQNSDKSISGNVSNSKNFRSGERITTSPVRGNAEKGAIVITASGSKYQLM